MRFRFCGDLDCPDWILAEINTLARMTSIKMKLLCQQVAKSLLNNDIDYERVKKLSSDSKFDESDVKASIAAVAFVLTSSARHNVDEEALSSELQQLGLPREHSIAICRVYRDNLSGLTAHLEARSLRLNHLENVCWRIDYTCSNLPQDSNPYLQPEVHLTFDVYDEINNQKINHQIMLSTGQLRMLVNDLRKVSNIMDSLQ